MTPEGSLLRTVTDLLDAERVWWMRCNSGMQVLMDRAGRKRVFRAGRPGMADLLATPKIMPDGEYGVTVPHPLWLELKSPRGRQSPAQHQFQSEVEAQGHIYLLVRDAQQMIDFLRGAK